MKKKNAFPPTTLAERGARTRDGRDLGLASTRGAALPLSGREVWAPSQRGRDRGERNRAPPRLPSARSSEKHEGEAPSSRSLSLLARGQQTSRTRWAHGRKAGAHEAANRAALAPRTTELQTLSLARKRAPQSRTGADDRLAARTPKHLSFFHENFLEA